ncbi:ATP-dependent RecD-like DNA helicase [Clostridium estertheticum]|uniref:SF1B family DNA helicase RecD2 n=1 Tax=Clostridium estertheticum TaxID=238834 RepID=UPI0013EE3FBB|nr:ATP-dependent RecD-like DNA helicase [Clostridium estertheticum]MBZ9606413.1 ATP-dependent RecD-like DNA helicase [Clostridium estertheticum]
MPEIQGIIEDVVFHNEENGYIIAHLNDNKKQITVVGIVPYISEGRNLKLTGEWVTHPQFGKQFRIIQCEEIIPSSLEGIEKYLASGVIQGIGPITAKKIVQHFGESTMNILDNEIERLKEIDGVGQKKIQLIFESYSKQREVKNIMIFLQTYGVTPNQCVKIYKKYGGDSIKVVQDNPYVLTETISGVGFKIADKIAQSLGIDKESPFRIQSGINYVVNEFCAMGNTYMPLNKLYKESKNILGVTAEEIEKNVYDNVLQGKLKVENIDEEDCVFTMPFYYCELAITKKIITLSIEKYDELEIDIQEKINDFEEEKNIKFATSQKTAICGAAENSIEIITGGPGTGKTTIINCIIEVFEEAGMKVYMAAPTGRAAKRMTEATGREAKTIHRLLELGVGRDDGSQFSRSEESPLDCDVLIIDEASMIDIMLMNSLLKAISVGTRLIIVGDVDQLPSVGPGNVLRDIIDSKCVKVVKLKEIFRQAQESMIIVNAHKINNGEMPILNKKDKDFYFIENNEPEKILDSIIALINTRLPKFNKKWDKMKNIQILSPMRKGILGIENLNGKLQQILNPKSKYKKEKEYRNTIFRVGDKVMQIKNNYSIKWKKINAKAEDGVGIFNGDVGYVEDIDEDNENVIVIFDDDKRVEYEGVYLDELALAYAITIHKSQGSEFEVVIMPMFMGPPLLMNRNLLYTGITRAKNMVVLVGAIKAVNFMKDNNRSFERYSALGWRIRQIVDTNVSHDEN